MNLRCLYCQTPFTLSRNEMLVALVTITEKNMNHYDAHCPRCRRANSISRQRMELFFPNWQEAAKNMPATTTSASSAAPTTGSASLKTQPLPKGVRKAAVKTSASKKSAATSAKPSASKRKRASKPASAKKSVPLKPSSKTTPKEVKKSATKKGKKK